MEKNQYKYVVWVGGIDDYYTTYQKALEDHNEWIEKGYEDIQLIKLNKGIKKWLTNLYHIRNLGKLEICPPLTVHAKLVRLLVH